MSDAGRETILMDGPLGTELEARGVPTPLPGWSAHALENAPEVVRAIHRSYAAAGARVHTTNTFRTRARLFPESWETLARRAVTLAREAVPPGDRVAGSIAPLWDCYRPQESPADEDPRTTRAAHRALARVLAAEGCDLLLCETFPHVGEGLLAAEEALATGVETWIAFTPGPSCTLLTPRAVADGARAAIARGVSAVLVNCVPAPKTLAFVRALAEVAGARGVLVGAYANTGSIDDVTGWESEPIDARAYAELALGWRDAGAGILGGCCGTGPAHIAALARAL